MIPRPVALSCQAMLVVLLSVTGCAVHRPSIQTYRLVQADARQILIPPGVAAPDVAQRTFKTTVAAGHGKCPSSPEAIGIVTKNKRARVTVTREMLLKQPAGWLNEWTAELETQGCIAPGAGPKLAELIAEALPLEMNQAFHLRYSNQMDITPQMTLQVTSPILREGAANTGSIAGPAETSGSGNSITVTVKSAANLLGYEMASYAVQAKADGIGLQIVPLYADRHIGSETERRAQPATNYFHFPGDAAFYRVFYEAEQTEYAALIIAGRTQAELERNTKTLATGTASCAKLNGELCVAVPKQVAINGFVPVTVNGSRTLVNWGANIGSVVRAAGERQSSAILPKLTVSKFYDDKLVAVEFDHANSAILNLIVTGGEVISW